jgi:hypothetical protein
LSPFSITEKRKQAMEIILKILGNGKEGSISRPGAGETDATPFVSFLQETNGVARQKEKRFCGSAKLHFHSVF